MTSIVTVPFHGDTLFALQRSDGVFVAVKPICQNLGLDWKAQHRRITSDAILSEGMVITAIPSPGGTQDAVCLRLDLVNGWLFGIDDRRLDAEVRDRVLQYKRECYAVLFRHFHPGTATQAPVVSENEAIRLRLITESRQTFGCKAAAQLWFKLGLPIVPAMLAASGQGELSI